VSVYPDTASVTTPGSVSYFVMELEELVELEELPDAEL